MELAEIQPKGCTKITAYLWSLDFHFSTKTMALADMCFKYSGTCNKYTC